MANAERRAISNKETESVPRISDLPALIATTCGKIELEYAGESRGEKQVVTKLLNAAVMNVFEEKVDIGDVKDIAAAFTEGLVIEVSDIRPAAAYQKDLGTVFGMRDAVGALYSSNGGQLGESPGLFASGAEFILEGLYLNKKLSKSALNGGASYKK